MPRGLVLLENLQGTCQAFRGVRGRVAAPIGFPDISGRLFLGSRRRFGNLGVALTFRTWSEANGRQGRASGSGAFENALRHLRLIRGPIAQHFSLKCVGEARPNPLAYGGVRVGTRADDRHEIGRLPGLLLRTEIG